MFYCFPWIDNGNETKSPFDLLGSSSALYGTIISSLNDYPRSKLTKALLLVMIEASIVYRNCHENMVFHATPSAIAKDTVTGFPFNTKTVL